jgi:SprT protein
MLADTRKTSHCQRDAAPRSLLRKAEEHTRSLLLQAGQRFGFAPPRLAVRFDLRGKTAGMVKFQRGKADYVVRYNPRLLAENRDDFLTQTVPHEVAHVVTNHLFGPRSKPHGAQWQAVMRFFGAEPKRCHGYDVSGTPARRLRRFDYHCACRTHRLTSIRHNRIQAGATYLCRHCGQVLFPGGRAD